MSYFERLSPAIATFYALMVMPAVHLMVMAAAGGSPVSPELYGPLVYALPAWAWAAMQIVICAACAVSAANVWTRVFIFWAILYAAMMICFSVMTQQGGAQGAVLMAHNVWVAVPIGLCSIGLAVKGTNRVG
jgi:hypothetical protein